MQNLGDALSAEIERFRLVNGLPPVGEWLRATEGISGRLRIELLWGRLELVLYDDGVLWARSAATGVGLAGTLPEVAAWLAVNGLDVRPEPSRYGLTDALPGTLDVRHNAVVFLGSSKGWALRRKESGMWTANYARDFPNCASACSWILAQEHANADR